MTNETHTDPQTAPADGDVVDAEALEEAPVDATATGEAGGEEEGPQFIEAFGKEAIISIALFIAFVVFAIVCLPTYIL